MILFPSSHEVARENAVGSFFAASLGSGNRREPWNNMSVDLESARLAVAVLRQEKLDLVAGKRMSDVRNEISANELLLIEFQPAVVLKGRQM